MPFGRSWTADKKPTPCPVPWLKSKPRSQGKIDFTQTPAKVSDVKNGSYDDKVALPNVVGKDVSEAKKTLETSGFTNVKVVDENGNSASSGKVESMTPSGGGKVSPSTEIKLVVKSATPDNG